LKITNILANALTTASPSSTITNQKIDLLKIGNTLDTNQVNQSIVNQFLMWGDNLVDSALSELYSTPLLEKGDFEAVLIASITEYNNYIVTDKPCPFNIGDMILLTDGVHEERHIIEENLNTMDNNMFSTTDAIVYPFIAYQTRVVRISYPYPISLVATQLSAAAIYDKYFASQSSPNESKYGQFLRTQARQEMNNVLNGRTVLHGQHRIGRRFYNPTLVDRYALPGTWGEPNIDDLGRA
jgi:hypothetical protein